MAGTEHFIETARAQPRDLIPASTPRGNHTITHFRVTENTTHNLA